MGIADNAYCWEKKNFVALFVYISDCPINIAKENSQQKDQY